ncbi:MAG: hypothetical protein ABIJ18_04670 [archaeon]
MDPLLKMAIEKYLDTPRINPSNFGKHGFVELRGYMSSVKKTLDLAWKAYENMAPLEEELAVQKLVDGEEEPNRNERNNLADVVDLLYSIDPQLASELDIPLQEEIRDPNVFPYEELPYIDADVVQCLVYLTAEFAQKVQFLTPANN